MNLLEDIVVIDFSQFLSGPSAGLRLADMGAQVIKIEKPYIGDICRELYVSDVMIHGESTIFHAINRNKQSYIADLKLDGDLYKIKEHPAYKILQMEQTITTGNGKQIITTRCPIRINGERLFSPAPAPELGANNKKIIEALLLKTSV